ncbi:MAG TPA: hypothetical protein VE593_06600, partial [Nitrososphaeraceae archaeon]|nr:hypothetical protein [Nitrososphaeraceae archaeon]
TFLCLLALGVIQMTSAMTTTNPVSSSASSPSSPSSNPRRRAIKYTAATYSIVAAVAILLLGAILKHGIILLPTFLIGLMAIACTGQVILDLRRHPHHRFSKFR